MDRRTRIIIYGILILALIVGYFVAGRGQGPDSEQILGVIERGRHSIETRDQSGVMSCVSKDYKDSMGNNYDRLRAIIAQGFRSASAFECTLSVPRVQVNGDDALARTHVTLASTIEGVRQKTFDGDVVLYLKKEKSRKYVIYPSKEWKVTSQEGIGALPDGAEMLP